MEEKKEQKAVYMPEMTDESVSMKADFGAYEIVIFDGENAGALFRTHTGYSVFVSPWTVTPYTDQPSSLYNALLSIVLMQRDGWDGEHKDELAFDDASTMKKGEVLEYYKMVAIAVLSRPIIAFGEDNFDLAIEDAKKYVESLDERALAVQKEAEKPKDSPDEQKILAEERNAAMVAETMESWMKSSE